MEAASSWQLSFSNSFALSLKAMISVGQTKVKSFGYQNRMTYLPYKGRHMHTMNDTIIS